MSYLLIFIKILSKRVRVIPCMIDCNIVGDRGWWMYVSDDIFSNIREKEKQVTMTEMPCKYTIKVKTYMHACTHANTQVIKHAHNKARTHAYAHNNIRERLLV